MCSSVERVGAPPPTHVNPRGSIATKNFALPTVFNAASFCERLNVKSSSTPIRMVFQINRDSFHCL